MFLSNLGSKPVKHISKLGSYQTFCFCLECLVSRNLAVQSVNYPYFNSPKTERENNAHKPSQYTEVGEPLGRGATPDRPRAEVEWGSMDCLRTSLRLYTENQKEPKRHFCLWSHHELLSHPKKTWILQCIRSALQYTIMKARCTAVHIMQAHFIPMLEHFK